MKYVKAAIPAAIAAIIFFFWVKHPVLKDYVYILKNFIPAAVIAAVYLGFGLKIQKILKISAPAIKYPLAFAISCGAVGTLFFAAGFLNLYNSVFAYAVLAALAALSYCEIKAMALDSAAYLKGLFNARIDPAGALYYAAAGFIFIYWFFVCLTPPVYYDTLVYHLAVPEQYIQAGGIINMKENIFSYYPQLMHMNCLFSMLIADELSVKLMYFFMGIMALAALSGIAGELKADKKIAVLLLLACPLFQLNSPRIGMELPLMFFTLLLVYVLIKTLALGFKAQDGILAGITAGLIMSVKYTGVVVYIFGAVVFLWLLLKKKAQVKGLIMYMLIPALIVLPYLIRNYCFTGGPFYPFFTGLFNVEPGLKTDAELYVAHVNGFGMPHTFLNLLKSPFEAVFNEKIFGGDAMSPLFLIAFAVLPLTNLKKTGLPAAFIVFYFVTWFFTGQVMRFLLPVMPLAALIAAQAYADTGSKLKFLACGLLVAVQAGFSLYFGENYLRPFQLFTLERKEYINRYVSYYNAANFINTNTERGAVILAMAEARTYYIKRRVVAYTVFNKRRIFDGFEGMSEEEFLERFKRRNIGYIMMNWDELDRLKDAGFGDVAAIAGSEKFKNIMDKYFGRIYSDAGCEVYKLREGNQ